MSYDASVLMNTDSRPDPDALLSAIQQAEALQHRGKLTIFLGMCAGVGKTYAMLEAARQRQADGVEVVLGLVETHGRVETERLLQGLPFVSRRSIRYRGVTLQELDLDAVLQRKPQLVLVDELAHTNAPGSRHPKRYQDVLELLEAGIDVYTTLNIQHIESRVDVVRQITGVAVQETIPDTILDQADHLQLVDLTPEDLRERLSDGKVYLGERAVTAASHFFREENLTALRELALRMTAEHVGHDVRSAMTERQIAGPWKTHAKLMVAVGPSPYSEELIRWTRRAAAAQGAPWVAVCVKARVELGEEEQARLTRHLSIARQLGAEIITVTDERLADALLRVARKENVTQIVVGKSLGPPLLELFKGGSLVEQLLRQSGDIDICAVRAGPKTAPPPHLVWKAASGASRAGELGLGFLAVALVTGACWWLRTVTGYWAIALVYLLLVVFLATRLRRTSVFLVTAISALLWDYLFIPPLFTFRIKDVQDALMLAMYFVVAWVIGHLTARLRFREMAERENEQRITALYHLAQEVVGSTSLHDGLRRAVRVIEEAFQAPSAVVLVDPDGRLNSIPEAGSLWTPDEKEHSVAAWALAHGQPAGRHTDTLPEADSLHLPLQTPKNKVGVLIVHFASRPPLTVEERELLETFADQIAVMIERYWLIQEAGRTQLAEESEKLYKTIFDSVSHELKTPLAVIQAATGELGLVFDALMEAQSARPFLNEINIASRRLSRIVDNLLSMTRIESGRIKVDPVWCDVDEIVTSARLQVGDLLARHQVQTLVPADLPSVKVDYGFLEQALANLLANAALYSPEDSQIRISAVTDEHHLVLRVSDEGPGLPPDVAAHVFEKFYRGPAAPAGGIGLGLSIVRGLMHALGGDISTQNNPERGATFTLRVPVEMKTIPASS